MDIVVVGWDIQLEVELDEERPTNEFYFAL